MSRRADQVTSESKYRYQIIRSQTRGRCLIACEAMPVGAVIINLDCPVSAVLYDHIPISPSNRPYALRSHEISMLEQARRSGNPHYQGSAVILAARVIEAERLSRKTEDAVVSLCLQPRPVEERFQVPRLITQRLLSAINIDVSSSKCEEILNKLSCNAFTIVDSLDNTQGIGIAFFRSV
jgi:hypothetical protein